MEPPARAEAPPVFACLGNRDALQSARLLVIVAHPDDEVIGVGGRLPNLKSSVFVHVTTGAKGRFSAEASCRFSELMTAIRLAALSPAQLLPMGRADQSLCYDLVGLTNEIRSLITAIKPHALLTHPYEGGHPDHDAVAFAVYAACQTTTQPPPVIEMAFYHQERCGICTGDFLADSDTPAITLQLSAIECALKRSLFRCFQSQAQMLSYFSVDTEKFRIAPSYDFTQAPHAGRLFYENFNWGIRSGGKWRALAREALMDLELHR